MSDEAEFTIEADYGYGHGWEEVDASNTLAEAKENLAAYREAEPYTSHRLLIDGEPAHAD